MSFVEHLDALRWHIIRSVIVLIIVTGVCFAFHKEIFQHVILAPLSGDFPFNKFACEINTDFCFEKLPVSFQAISPTEQISKAFMISLVAGFMLAFPYIIWEFWRFLKPGLYITEIKATRGFVFIISFLFLCGVSFAYFIITPVTFQFLANFSIDDNIQNIWRVGEVMTMIAQFALAGGLLFQLPVLTYWIARLGLITPAFMRKYRKHAIVFSTLLSGVITPPDVMSQILLALPIILLYEISIWVCAGVYKKQEMRNNISEV